jgi:hypothetical protein
MYIEPALDCGLERAKGERGLSGEDTNCERAGKLLVNRGAEGCS